MTEDRDLRIEAVPTPIGTVLLRHDGLLLHRLDFVDDASSAAAQAPGSSAFAAAVRAYFAGDVRALDRLPVVARGTAFQTMVWLALRQIPPGQTWSYRQLAQAVGRPAAVRAVGAANGRNPLSLVLPCHRVIGADGRLTGYGGGLERKAWLLRHEGAPCA